MQVTARRNRKRLEAQLRASRPEARDEFVHSLSSSIEPAPVRGTGLRVRVAFSGVLTVGLLGALGAVGGIGYAATAAQQAAHVVKKVFVPSGSQSAIVVRGLSSGEDQYRPGYGWGDDNHTHTGPPKMHRGGKKGSFAPPAQARTTDGGIAGVVATKFAVDEQAHLFISVVNSKGKKLLLTQKSKRGGSAVGGSLDGPQTKTIQYLVLVPRTIPLNLRVPANLLQPGETYRIRVIARDPDGQKSTLYLPFAS
jgi:hypothetical protein